MKGRVTYRNPLPQRRTSGKASVSRIARRLARKQARKARKAKR